jgi:hypothetical protein
MDDSIVKPEIADLGWIAEHITQQVIDYLSPSIIRLREVAYILNYSLIFRT